MSKVMMWLLGIALLFVVAGCKQSGRDSEGSMKMSGDSSMSTSAPSTIPAAMTYTCTMHPDVVSDKPGKCPKCGMDLVVKK